MPIPRFTEQIRSCSEAEQNLKPTLPTPDGIAISIQMPRGFLNDNCLLQRWPRFPDASNSASGADMIYFYVQLSVD